MGGKRERERRDMGKDREEKIGKGKERRRGGERWK
jgi:hypothetical protein